MVIAFTTFAFQASLAGARTIEGEASALLRANAQPLWLEEVLLGAQVGSAGDVPFLGSLDEIRGSTYAWSPLGWKEPAAFHVFRRDGQVIVEAGESQVVIAHADSLQFSYRATTAEASWLASWQSPVSLPLAVRMIRSQPDGKDTVLLLVGHP
jgi:hypothetical protein